MFSRDADRQERPDGTILRAAACQPRRPAEDGRPPERAHLHGFSDEKPSCGRNAMYCHLNVKTGTRADGQSAVAKYEYISRIGKYSFGFHDDVVHVESGNMPAFAASDPRLYWIAADEHERSNGRLFRSLTGALPNALDFAARLALARSFAVEVTGGELPYTLALHAGDVNRGAAPDNPHFHLVFSERVNDGVLRTAEAWFRRAASKGRDPALGGARKSTRTKPREWLVETRHGWAAKLNQALERAGIAERVTAESHETLLAGAAVAGDVMEMERLLLNPPSPHIGPSAKHRWEDRDLAEQADRYAQHEKAVERAWSIWWTHTKQLAEAEVGWAQVDALDVRIAELEAERRVEEATAAEREERERQERQEAEQRAAEERRRAEPGGTAKQRSTRCRGVTCGGWRSNGKSSPARVVY